MLPSNIVSENLPRAYGDTEGTTSRIPGPPTTDQIAAGDFITVQAARERLGLKAVSAVYKLMDQGVLAYVRSTGYTGRARRVSVVSLNYFIRQNLIVR
jgi:hypothetical protein